MTARAPRALPCPRAHLPPLAKLLEPVVKLACHHDLRQGQRGFILEPCSPFIAMRRQCTLVHMLAMCPALPCRPPPPPHRALVVWVHLLRQAARHQRPAGHMTKAQAAARRRPSAPVPHSPTRALPEALAGRRAPIAAQPLLACSTCIQRLEHHSTLDCCRKRMRRCAGAHCALTICRMSSGVVSASPLRALRMNPAERRHATAAALGRAQGKTSAVTPEIKENKK